MVEAHRAVWQLPRGDGAGCPTRCQARNGESRGQSADPEQRRSRVEAMAARSENGALKNLVLDVAPDPAGVRWETDSKLGGGRR